MVIKSSFAFSNPFNFHPYMLNNCHPYLFNVILLKDITNYGSDSFKSKSKLHDIATTKHCLSDIPDPSFGSGIWVWNWGSGIFPHPRKFSRTRNFPLKPSFLPQNSPNSRFWARSIGLGRNSWFRGFSQGLEKFLTLDSGPKFRTRRMGPECQMGSAVI